MADRSRRVFLAEKRQHEQHVAAPARRLLHGAAPGEPGFRLGLVTILDGQGRQALVAWKEELGLAHRFRDGQRFPVVALALDVVAAALTDLRQNDQWDW